MRAVGLDEFEALAGRPPVVFAGAPYARVHAARTPQLLPLVCSLGHRQAGIICGCDGTTLSAPFSAPFADFCCSAGASAPLLLHAAGALVDYARSRGLAMRFVAAPPIYGNSGPLAVAALAAAGLKVSRTDIGYALPLREKLQFNRMRRRQLGMSEAGQLHTIIASGAEAPELLARAYAVVEANRTELGYALSMSEADVRRAMQVVDAHVAITQYGTSDVGSAIIFDVAPRVKQVIFWGDMPRTRGALPVMSVLAQALSSHFAAAGDLWLDLGPATLQGRILPGLAMFKQSLGAEAYTRIELSL